MSGNITPQPDTPSEYVSERATTWILQDNLRLFLERGSALIAYPFDESDWDAVRFGARETNIARNEWYEYELFGEPSVKFAFAEQGDRRCVRVHIETSDSVLTRLAALARIMQCYEETSAALEILTQSAFLETQEPFQGKLMSCAPEHLAICEECQEAQEFFSGKRWIDLLQGDYRLPWGWADAVFLSKEARRYFFPAYLVSAIHNKDDNETDALDYALKLVEQENWTPLQQALIEFATYLITRRVP